MVGGGLIGRVKDTEKIENCHFTGDIYSNNEIGGLIGTCETTASILSCSVSGTVSAEKSIGGLIGNRRGEITLTNCHVTGVLKTQSDFSSGLIYTGMGQLKCEITACSFDGIVSSPKFTPFTGFSEKSKVTISDSYYRVLLQNPDKTFVERIDELTTDRVYSEIVCGVVDITETTVSSEEDLRSCSPFSNIKLTDDITLSKSEHIIDDFYGIIDGDGYSIINTTTPLFGTVHDESIIKNLTIQYSDIRQSKRIRTGVVCENNKATLEHLTVTNCTIEQEESRMSGLITGSNKNQITNSTVEKSDIHGSKKVGSICGQSRGEIHNCHAESVSLTGILKVGGLVGCIRENSKVRSCSVLSTEIDGKRRIGGVCGLKFSGSITSTTVDKITCSGTEQIGGIVGVLISSDLSCCHVRDSQLEGIEKIGGVFGTVESGGDIRNCSCSVTIKGKEKVGGFGFKTIDCTIKQSFSSGNIYANSFCSGFVHDPVSNNSFKDCFAIGTFNCRKEIHAFCSKEPESIRQCYWNFSSKILQNTTESSKIDTTDITELKIYALI